MPRHVVEAAVESPTIPATVRAWRGATEWDIMLLYQAGGDCRVSRRRARSSRQMTTVSQMASNHSRQRLQAGLSLGGHPGSMFVT